MDNDENKLIGKIYETALAPEDWVDLLDIVAGWSKDGEVSESDSPLAEVEGGRPPMRSAQVGALVEHLERAVRSSSYMHAMEDRISVFNSMYNHMPWPMLMLGDNLAVLDCNPVAQQMLGEGAVTLRDERELVFQDKALRSALVAVNKLETGRNPQLLSSSRDGISILCLPVQTSNAPGTISLVRTIVWVLDGHSVVTPSASLLSSLFNITPTESRLLHLLCKIGDLQQCAELLNIKISTARSHLKSMKAKLNVSTQVQLVSHAMGHALAQMARLPKPVDAQEEYAISLPDGRVLSWYEYGDPQGRPVINLENQGSSMPDHTLFESWYQEQGLRMIMIVRPGYGISTYKENFQFRDFGEDILFLCKHLRIQRPALAAYCGGGPYALCAAAMYPDSFECLGLISPTFAIEHIELEKMDPLHRMSVQISRRDPRLFMLIGRLGIRGVQKSPEKFYKKFAKGLSDSDKKFFDNPDMVKRMISRTNRSHFQGARVMMEEYLNHLKPLGVDLSQIQIPVVQWHGEDDGVMSIGGARSLAADIPGVRFRSFPGLGHYMVYEHWQDFLRELLGLDGK